jgi:hypothetical protein
MEKFAWVALGLLAFGCGFKRDGDSDGSVGGDVDGGDLPGGTDLASSAEADLSWQRDLAVSDGGVDVPDLAGDPPDMARRPWVWTTETVNSRPHILYGVWATAGNDVYVVGGGIYHSTGNGVWSENQAPTDTDPLFGISGSGSDVVAVGDNGTVLRHRASGWDSVWSDSTAMFLAVSVDPSRIFTVGIVGAYAEITSAGPNAGHWITDGDPLTSVWGIGDDVYMTAPGRIYHDSAGSWHESPLGDQVGFFGIWGASNNDIWAVGDKGVIYHSSGFDSWTKQVSGDARKLDAVSGSGPDDVWVTGASGAVLHFDGTRWEHVDVGSRDELWGAWVGPNDIYFAADDSKVVHGRRP